VEKLHLTDRLAWKAYREQQMHCRLGAQMQVAFSRKGILRSGIAGSVYSICQLRRSNPW
jgi:hypothetical protein